jgi:threonine/homoserine/homoserine lactone efflux protein
MALHFFLGFSISFLGALPPGALNLTAAETGLQRGMAATFLFALGVATIEYAQAYLAIRFSGFLTANPQIQEYLHIAAVPIFALLAFGYLWVALRSKTKTDAKDKPLDRSPSAPPFRKGLLLSLANPLAIPFWLAWAALLHSQNRLILDAWHIHIFVLGIICGTLVPLLFFGWLGRQLLQRVASAERWVNLSIGLVFLSVAVSQAWKLAQ